MINRYALLWFPMVVVAIANGALREFLIAPYTGDAIGHHLSVVTFLMLFALYLFLIGKRWKIVSERQALVIGGLWLGMTIAFEFIFGHYVMGHPWEKLLHDHNILEGRLWTVVLAGIFAGPWAMFRLTSKRTS